MDGTDVGRVSVQVRPPWTYWFYFFLPFAIPVSMYVDDRREGWIWWYQTRTVELVGPHEVSLTWLFDRQSRHVDVRSGDVTRLLYRPPATRVSSGKLREVPRELAG